MIWFFVGFTVFVVLIIVVSVFAAKRRREALSLMAEVLNLEFSAKGDESLIPSLQHFSLFTRGHSKKATNVLHGNANDIDVTIMDYQFTTGGGKNSSTSLQTVIVFKSDLLKLPVFTIRPEHFFHRIGCAFGYQDINFDTQPLFSKQYLLQGEDEQAIRDFFTDEMFAFYTQRKGFCTEAKGHELIYYRFAKKVKPDMIKTFMQEGFGLFGLLKAASN